MSIHLDTPAAPRIAACGDARATHFTRWRWKVTCKTCTMVTAARPMDAAREADVTYRADLPIRYTRLVAFVRQQALPNCDEALAEFERERAVAARCPTCGPLPDPIAMFDVVTNRMVFACPACTTGVMRALWESEGR
jgi:hypothetical protein